MSQLSHINNGEDTMKKKNVYRIFLFLSTFTRGLVEVFSLVLLYKKGFTMANLFFFLFLSYAFGILVNYVSLRCSHQKILCLSSILYGSSFLYLTYMKPTMGSFVLLACLLASGNYSFHAIKHLLALELLEDSQKDSHKIIMITYLGVIVSSFAGIYLIEKLPFIVTSIIIFILSFLAIFPVLKLQYKPAPYSKQNFTKVSIKRDKLIFNILEQFKVIFLELQPLFLYLYVDKSISYVGIFNVIVNVASLIVVYFLGKRIKRCYFKYICFLLGFIFLLKLNITNNIFLLGLAFFEGILVKIYENVSLRNLYTIGTNPIREYLILEECIFFGSKSIIMLVVCLFHFNIYMIMYIAIIGLILSGFFMKEEC